MYGSGDWNPREHAEDLQMLIPSVQIEIIQDATHVLYNTNNYAEMCENIIKFCDENQQRKETSNLNDGSDSTTTKEKSVEINDSQSETRDS